MKILINTDKGKFRQALKDTGFEYDGMIFNDRRMSGIRRLKLYTGREVCGADSVKMDKLRVALKEQFGSRYYSSYIRNGMTFRGTIRSFCVEIVPDGWYD